MQVFPNNIQESGENDPVEKLGLRKCYCKSIVPHPKDPEKKICSCGLDIEEHKRAVVSTFREQGASEKEWTKEQCAGDDGPSDGYGEILFQGASDTVTLYARMSYKTDMDTAWRLLFDDDFWHLRKPGLIIAVTGGATLPQLKAQLKDTFSKGLVKVATTTNALITSGAMNTGCMKLVGEAFKDNQLSLGDDLVTVLGIVNWGAVYNNKVLSQYKRKRNGNPAEYEMVKPKMKNDFVNSGLLDPNHSHLLLIDNAKAAYGDENEFRARLESTIATKLKIPIIVLVLGGGPRTADNVCETVVKNRTPCVFLESSGEGADIFSFALKRIDRCNEQIQKKEKSITLKEFLNDDTFRDEIRDKIEKSFPGKPENAKKIFEKTMEVLKEENLHLLNVCRPVNGKAEIDVAILRALLQKDRASSDNQNDFRGQIRLALKWDRIDIARNFIFTDKNREHIGALDEFMVYAIEHDRVEFVKLFLEMGFSLKNFVTPRVLLRLYNNLEVKDGGLLRNYIHKMNDVYETERLTFRMIGAAIESLLDDFYKHRFTQSWLGKIRNEHLEKILNDTLKEGTVGQLVHDEDHLTSLINIDERMDFAEHELFMLNVLAGRDKMSQLFCAEGRNALCSALIATKILKTYADAFEDQRDELNGIAKNFEKLACDILQACYDDDKEKAEQTLTRKILEYDNCTAMQAAILSNDLDFVALPCFQNVLDSIWYSKLQPDVDGYFQVSFLIQSES